MILALLSKADRKRIQLKVDTITESPLFIKAIKELRQKWNITDCGLKGSQARFYARLVAAAANTKTIAKFQNDIHDIVDKFGLPKRYTNFIHEYIFSPNKLKQSLKQLSPLRILPLAFDSNGEMVVAIHLYGDINKEDYVGAWPSIEKHVNGMRLKGRELKDYKQFIRDRHFLQTKLENPNITDSNLGDSYQALMNNDIIDVQHVRIARNRYKKWARLHRQDYYDGYAMDRYLHNLEEMYPKANDNELAKKYEKLTENKITPKEIKFRRERYQRWNGRNSKS